MRRRLGIRRSAIVAHLVPSTEGSLALSFQRRFLISVGANLVRAGLSFMTGMLLARGLGPTLYGDMAFLLGTFVSIRALLDLGSSSAFYTFISQRPRGPVFFLRFSGWLATQFVLTALFVCWLAPDSLFLRVWLTQPREMVVLALLASFVQQPLWTVVGYVGESLRRTHQVQLLSTLVSLFYLLVVALLLWLDKLTLPRVFVLLALQYAVASLGAYFWWRGEIGAQPASPPSWSDMFDEYRRYCAPMVALSVVTFFYSFLDRWLLQWAGGSEQQGFFQVASQFAQVSLLAAISVMNIFWREVAEAWEKRDHAKVARLYQLISRGLVLLSAALTGLVLPWVPLLLGPLLGKAYDGAWLVLSVMLCYPVHQSLGQVNGAMLLACGRTREQMFNGLLSMLVSIPVSYFVLAPEQAAIPGLKLGALGLALKALAVSLIMVNFQSWLLARYHGWRFDWRYQLFGIPFLILLGWVLSFPLQLAVDSLDLAWLGALLAFCVAAPLYLAAVLLLIWKCPKCLGLGPAEQSLMLLLWQRIQCRFGAPRI